MPKKIEDLDEELCKHCPIDEEYRGVHGSPGGFSAGCEGSRCAEAYQNYLDNDEED